MTGYWADNYWPLCYVTEPITIPLTIPQLEGKWGRADVYEADIEYITETRTMKIYLAVSDFPDNFEDTYKTHGQFYSNNPANR